MQWFTNVIIGIVVVCASGKLAPADSFSVYNVSGSGGVDTTFGGTLTVDNTLNKFSNSTVTLTSTEASGEFPDFFTTASASGYRLIFGSSTNPDPDFEFDFSSPDLTSFSCSGTSFVGTISYYRFSLVFPLAGEITPVPELGSMTGLIAVASGLRTRGRSNSVRLFALNTLEIEETHGAA